MAKSKTDNDITTYNDVIKSLEHNRNTQQAVVLIREMRKLIEVLVDDGYQLNLAGDTKATVTIDEFLNGVASGWARLVQ